MVVTLQEMKDYLRVDGDYDDALIGYMMQAAQKICMDIARADDEAAFDAMEFSRVAILFTTAYLYEHREEADHHKLTMTLRSLMEGERGVLF